MIQRAKWQLDRARQSGRPIMQVEYEFSVI
jgi:hypothetical protein